jgi:hypothetical protein
MRGTSVHRFLGLAAAGVAAVGLVVAAPADAAKDKGNGKSYAAPFKVGAGGGDSFSYHSASDDGTVTVARAYPLIGAINCTKGGPYATLLVKHHATKPVHKVVVSYESAALDNFTFIMVGLHDTKDNWYGTKQVRGFVTGSGKVVLVPDRPQGAFPRTLIVEFGLQQSSACPNVDAGTIRFTKVQVS